MRRQMGQDLPPAGMLPVDWFSGFGPPTRPPSPRDSLARVASRAFVPFTAAGQRENLTPLPLSTMIFYDNNNYTKKLRFVKPLFSVFKLFMLKWFMSQLPVFH